jgi:hypothetical protein
MDRRKPGLASPAILRVRLIDRSKIRAGVRVSAMNGADPRRPLNSSTREARSSL